MPPDIRNIGKRVMILDGAMGTLLTQMKGGITGPLESLNVTDPELVAKAHKQYADAGADIVVTNTFGANRFILFRHGMGYRVEDFNRGAVVAARKGVKGRALIAGSIGPTGKLMEPFGQVRFEELFDGFLEQAGYLSAEGVDLFSIETMSDLGELRAAIMACREASQSTPVIANMTFCENGRTIWGTDPLTYLSAIEPHKPIALGINCGIGPKAMLPMVQELCRESVLPISVMPNAGMPRISSGVTIYPVGPEKMGVYARQLVRSGCSLVGSCCGSTPKHTAAIANAVKGAPVSCEMKTRPPGPVCSLASSGQTVRAGYGYPLVSIGERINPTGKKKLSEELENGIFLQLAREARRQAAAGARMLDINVSVRLNDEGWLMRRAVTEVQKVTALPISIDSINVNAIEAGLKSAIGRPLINSVSGDPERLDILLPMAKKFGAALIGLCLDNKGIPATPAGRVDVARRILAKAEEYGLGLDDILFDPLTLTISADTGSAEVTLQTLRMLKVELKANTVIGLSNISHGMPQRPLINSAFLAMAAESGLDAVIINPIGAVEMGYLYAVNVLTGKEPKAVRILKRLAANGMSIGVVEGTVKKPSGEEVKPAEQIAPPAEDSVSMLIKLVMEGDGESGAKLVRKLISKGKDPESLLDEALIPAMERVSEMFSSADFFLPEALLASEAFKECLNEIQRHQKRKSRTVKGKVLLATVHGDIHDIGKNLVKMVLENSGYETIDLGANVTTAEIIDVAKQDKPDIIALSALMTTTMGEMRNVVNELQRAELDPDVIVGGAVVTSKYALEIGASAYGADAMEGLRKADNIMRSRKRRK